MMDDRYADCHVEKESVVGDDIITTTHCQNYLLGMWEALAVMFSINTLRRTVERQAFPAPLVVIFP